MSFLPQNHFLSYPRSAASVTLWSQQLHSAPDCHCQNKCWAEPGGFGLLPGQRKTSTGDRGELQLPLEKVTELRLNEAGTPVPLYCKITLVHCAAGIYPNLHSPCGYSELEHIQLLSLQEAVHLSITCLCDIRSAGVSRLQAARAGARQLWHEAILSSDTHCSWTACLTHFWIMYVL